MFAWLNRLVIFVLIPIHLRFWFSLGLFLLLLLLILLLLLLCVLFLLSLLSIHYILDTIAYAKYQQYGYKLLRTEQKMYLELSMIIV